MIMNTWKAASEICCCKVLNFFYLFPDHGVLCEGWGFPVEASEVNGWGPSVLEGVDVVMSHRNMARVVTKPRNVRDHVLTVPLYWNYKGKSRSVFLVNCILRLICGLRNKQSFYLGKNNQIQCTFDIATGLRHGGWGRYLCIVRAPSCIGVEVAISKVSISNGHCITKHCGR